MTASTTSNDQERRIGPSSFRSVENPRRDSAWQRADNSLPHFPGNGKVDHALTRSMKQQGRPMRAVAWGMFALLSGCDTAPRDAAPAHRAAAAARAMGLTIPRTARVVFVEEMHGIDDAARLILVLPAADWRRLDRRIVQAAPPAPPFSREGGHQLGPNGGGWTPDRHHGLVVRQISWRAGTESLTVGVAPAGARQVRVFLFWHQL